MPVGLSKTRSGVKGMRRGAKGPERGPLELAQEAVNKFEEEYNNLINMREEFGDKFPEAAAFQQDMLRQEDAVQDCINDAVPLIREARQNVGDFTCQVKKSKPRYDDKNFLELVTQLEEGGNILMNLIEGGYIKKVALDPSAAAYFAQHPMEAEHFQPAWRDAAEMTPAVTAPKI